MLAAIVTAAYDEIHQTFIPSRTGRWQDVVIDTSGAIVMQVMVYLLATRKQRQTTQANVHKQGCEPGAATPDADESVESVPHVRPCRLM